jgi:hypothetical protein
MKKLSLLLFSATTLALHASEQSFSFQGSIPFINKCNSEYKKADAFLSIAQFIEDHELKNCNTSNPILHDLVIDNNGNRWINKGKDISRLLNAKLLRNFVEKNNLTNVKIPEKRILKVPCEKHSKDNCIKCPASESFTVLAEEIEADRSQKHFNQKHLESFLQIIQHTGYSDWDYSNIISTDDGKAVFIDTEDKSFKVRPRLESIIPLLVNHDFDGIIDFTTITTPYNQLFRKTYRYEKNHKFFTQNPVMVDVLIFGPKSIYAECYKGDNAEIIKKYQNIFTNDNKLPADDVKRFNALHEQKAIFTDKKTGKKIDFEIIRKFLSTNTMLCK